MYLVQHLIKLISLKCYIVVAIIFCFSHSFAQKNNYTSVYAKEFKQQKKISYNTKLFSLSESVPDKKWSNYKGGAINTEDSLYYFNENLLCFSFPTNSNKIRNEYLAFYFSQKSAKCPTLFSLLNYYSPIIKQNLDSNNLPKELKLLPAVLSGFNPNSSNQIGGEGYWHLNYPQAIKYGLTINEYLDERKDFQKSTKAATQYIKDLYEKYNDWELTLTAYSCGVVTVNKLFKRHQVKSYKEIYPFLQKETKDLVQAFVAMNYIYNYDSYGAVQLLPIIEMDTIQIENKLKFEAINHVIKTKNKQFAFLNPILTKTTFPSNFKAYFPKGMGKKFQHYKDSIYFYQDSVLLRPEPAKPEFVIPKDGEPYTYSVKSGDVLGVIAQRFNVRVSQLQAWNNISGTRIDIGQKIMIYGKKKTTKKEAKPDTKKHVVVVEKKKTPKEISPIKNKGVQTSYTVKSGDNLWIIAKKFSGVSGQNIMDFNKIDADLKVGQLLKIPKP